MVKLHCGFCDIIFESKPTEDWICPNCEMTDVFNVFEISQQEIDEMNKGLDYIELIDGLAKIDLPPIIDGSQGIYASMTSKEGLEDALYVLPLLFNRIFLRGLHNLDKRSIPKDKIKITAELIDSGIVVPVSYGLERWALPFEGSRNIIHSSDIMNYSILKNLVTSLSYEDMRAMDNETISRLKEEIVVDIFPIDNKYLERMQFLFLLKNDLVDFNIDLLTSAKFGIPFLFEPKVEEIYNWKMKHLTKVYGENVSNEFEAVKRFFNSLSISIPSLLTIDDIISFRKEKAIKNFRKILFSLSTRFQKDSSTDISQDLLIEFNQKVNEFNETATSYGEIASILLSGGVSTIGGMAGALVGGISACVVSPITKSVFKKVYKETHKDWIYFFLKWQKRRFEFV